MKSGKRAAKGPNQRLRQRTAILIIIILVFGFGAVLGRLSFLTLVQGSELQEKAVNQQLKDTTIPAKRGSIFDVNGKVLAESASVWQVVMAPINFKDDRQREAVAEGLSDILDLKYENVLEKTKQESYYVVVKRKIEVEQRDKVLEFIDEIDEKYDCGNVIQLLDDYKRYYPKDDLASCVIGFAGSDEQGLEGVEYQYDEYLSGTPGRMVTATNARGTNMPFSFEQNIEAKDGDNIYLTIDETVQSICEKYMKQGIINNNVLNRGVCIAMDVNTGALIACVTVDGYNLNDPYTLPDETKQEIEELPKDEQAEAEGAALAAMWRNKAITDTYMPGSVFKICTASMALEEGKVNDNTTFVCGGAVTFGNDTIHCHARGGHGNQTFVQAICNSCNPAFIQIGQLVGIEKFREYYQGFGFSEKSGIDLPGEAEDNFWQEGTMSEVDFAVASFGQNFSITPIQMITATAAVANGGYVLQPYVVSKITDSNGNVVKNVEKKVKRQVISKATSDKMNEILAYNTETAGATSGYVTGYKIAGKTGTSEKVGAGEVKSVFNEDYIASFCGYAPADDPQIAMLVFFDTPSGGSYYGSQVSYPVFINIMTEVLPYLEIKTSYSDDELAYIDVSAGDYTGLSISEAQEAAEKDGFTTTVRGSGEKVIAQIPTVSSKVSTGGNIVLYTDEDSKSELVTVPNLVGMSAAEVNSYASAYDLNVSFSGAVSSGGLSSTQDIAEGTQVSPGTVISVSFTGSSATFND
ncbi:MAG: PASTA domain-containing protein [Ruminococcus sp.]|nr:PASTA domain-containing protein [Ruminococcus sp.]